MRKLVLVSVFAFVLLIPFSERTRRLLQPLCFWGQPLGFREQRYRPGART